MGAYRNVVASSSNCWLIDFPQTVRVGLQLLGISILMPIENKFLKIRTPGLTNRYQEWVYFIEAECNPILIKIGKSTSLQKRLSTLQFMSPVQLKLIGAVLGPSGSEFVFHELFAGARAHGEWFSPVSELLQLIKVLPKGGEINIADLVKFGFDLKVPEDRVRGIIRTAATKRATPGMKKGVAAYNERYRMNSPR